jgi:hypothetical protein
MKQKPLTKAIATMLAEKVRQKLAEQTLDWSSKYKDKLEKSKEFKEYIKLWEQREVISSRMSALSEQFSQNNTTDLAKISINTYTSKAPTISIRESSKVSVDGIRDMLLLEDYFSNSTVTPEEMVDVVVKKLLTTKTK